jgi:hypothetical protein
MYRQARGERIKSCAVRITELNNFVMQVRWSNAGHSGAKGFQQSKQGNVKDAAALMRPASADLLVQRPVSKRVNGSRADNNDAVLIDRVGLMTTGYEKSDDHGGPSPTVFLLAVGAVLILLLCGFYLLSR